ncbi:tumor necrosis factor receptor superfamily member 14-like isoform X6 [Anguilla anguilla]|uniref:tumor necrosis factor receptor superfamily member 14-like isoform X6 n=1 Tax=Anguilla anguilla TaxID=7936 RepID=UPI0015AB004F|nr:tumor necrosis factor receptor superfamily member 14-like isoform X6 [Anguilla anguilla]
MIKLTEVVACLCLRRSFRLDHGNQDLHKGKKSDHNFVNYDRWTSIKLTAYLLLLFCGLAYSCGSAEYEINGECCPMCTPGTHVYKHCTEFANTSCVPCTQKSFIAVPTGLSHCLSCTVCEPDLGLKTERECTPTSDTVCGPLDHHYCTKTDNKGCSFAHKHTICRPGQFILHNGTTSTNTECGYCPDKTFSNKSFSAYCRPHTDCLSFGLQEMTAGTNTSDSECGPRNIPVYIIIVPVMLALAVILAIIFILRKFHPLSGKSLNFIFNKLVNGLNSSLRLAVLPIFCELKSLYLYNRYEWLAYKIFNN